MLAFVFLVPALTVSRAADERIVRDVAAICPAFDEQYWLGMTIGHGSELVPRTKLTGAPYSLNAQGIRVGNIIPQSGDASVELTADAIATDEIKNETGTASAVNGTGVAVLGGTPLGLLSRSITVPDSGYVMVVDTCEARGAHVNGTNSDADFGVSEDFTFPSNQDFR